MSFPADSPQKADDINRSKSSDTFLAYSCNRFLIFLLLIRLFCLRIAMIVFAIFILSAKTDCCATVLRKVSDCIDPVPRVLSLASKKEKSLVTISYRLRAFSNFVSSRKLGRLELNNTSNTSYALNCSMLL